MMYECSNCGEKYHSQRGAEDCYASHLQAKKKRGFTKAELLTLAQAADLAVLNQCADLAARLRRMAGKP